MTSRRVTFFLASLADDAGLRHQEVGFARALARRTRDVSILSYFRPAVAEAPGLPVRTVVPTRFHGALHEGPLSWLVAGRVSRALRELSPDAVVVTEPREAQLALRHRDRTGCAVVYRIATLEGVPSRETAPVRRNGRAGPLVELLRRVDRVLAPSAFVRAELGEVDVDARVLPMGVDTARFRPGCRLPGIRITAPQVLFVGTYDREGGAFKVVRAFRRVLARCPEAVLQMHGRASSAPEVERISSYVEEHGLRRRVFLFGPIERTELPYRLTQASVVVDGSTRCAFGVHLLEAHACGVPCVAFRAGGVPEVVEHADTGLLAQAGDVDALAQALGRVLCEDARRVALARAAGERAQRFGFDRLAPFLERTLDELGAPRRQPRPAPLPQGQSG